MGSSVYLLYFVAGVIRLLFSISGLSSVIKSSIEVSTPLNSWKRVTEGAYLDKHGIDPYSGSLFHETPIGLEVYKLFLKLNSQWLPFVFVICDFATAFTLFLVAKVYINDLLSNQKKKMKEYASDVASILIYPDDLRTIPHYVAWMYLFNPYSILTCIGMTTTVFSNLFLAMTVMLAMKGFRIASTFTLAFAIYQSFYPVILLVPVSLCILKKSNGNEINYKHRSTWCSIAATCVCCCVWFAVLIMYSHHITGNWKFLSSVYGFILMVTDLTPNLGLFWYFFTEMFDHFYVFFVCTFQLNVFVYVLPLAIRFRHEPFLLFFSLCCLMAVFKSYPSVGDVAFYLSFIPLWKHLHKYMRQSFVICGFFLACSVLGPITRYLWLYAGSANANFYFGITLAFATGQIFLLTDILFAYTKREFHLHRGVTLTVNGEPAKIVLT